MRSLRLLLLAALLGLLVACSGSSKEKPAPVVIDTTTTWCGEAVCVTVSFLCKEEERVSIGMVVGGLTKAPVSAKIVIERNPGKPSTFTKEIVANGTPLGAAPVREEGVSYTLRAFQEGTEIANATRRPGDSCKKGDEPFVE